MVVYTFWVLSQGYPPFPFDLRNVSFRECNWITFQVSGIHPMRCVATIPPSDRPIKSIGAGQGQGRWCLRRYLKRWWLKILNLAIHCDLFGMVKWPFSMVVGDLQLGDEKVTAWITWKKWPYFFGKVPFGGLWPSIFQGQTSVLSWLAAYQLAFC